MINKTNSRNRDRSRIVAGLILVVVGTALLMRNMGYFMPSWLFTWPVILILLGIYSGIKHNFRNNSWLILTGIGFFFLADDLMPGLKLEPAFWPILIIALGLIFIIRPRRNKFVDNPLNIDQANKINDINEGSWQNTAADIPYERLDFLRVDSVFSGLNRRVLTRNFQGGRISCVFGGAEIDLIQADINGTVVLKIDLVFGGLKLIVPPNWTVQNQVGGVFHGVDDNRKYDEAVAMDPAKILVLKGTAVFAGIEIRRR